MKIMERNKRRFWYLLYEGTEPLKDDAGYETGESRVVYGEPVAMRANVSAASGSAQVEQFGDLAGYDRVIVTDDMVCPIDEHSVLFLEGEPVYAEDGTPQYDHIVRRVARALDSIAYAVRKVSVS